MNRLKFSWNALVYWFEHGDLVPLIVIVSAVHYSLMLHAYDHPAVAIAIGLLVDLGHFRTVRAAVRYNGSQKRVQFVRWMMALAMTVVAVAYQQRYYGDWWLSLPLPFLIASLAWLQHVDRATGSKPQAVVTISKPLVSEVKPEALPQPVRKRFDCPECGRTFGSQNALNAHQRIHERVGAINGNHK